MTAIARTIPRPFVILAAGVAIATLAVLFLRTPQSSLALDPRGVLCGSAVAGNISAQFELSRASDYRQRFPKMGISPELETSEAAFFVVYGGNAKLFGVSGAPPAQDENGNVGPAAPLETTADGVVCVVVGGQPIVYVNVDTN